MIDPAMLRPGRLDKTLYVDLPSAHERAEILRTLTRRTPLRSDVDLIALANDARCDGFSGADLAALVREAAVSALRASILYRPGGNLIGFSHGNSTNESNSIKDRKAPSLTETAEVWVTPNDFLIAFSKMAPSVSRKDRRKYELLKVKFSSSSASSSLSSQPPQES